jgi:allophanate hydrolase subunit 2
LSKQPTADQPRDEAARGLDSAILNKMFKGEVTDYADALNVKIKPADAKTWASGTTIGWANESMRVAATSVYPGVEEGACPYLTKDYVTKAEPVIEQQSERAGVRLATVLNTVSAAPRR